jgi:hypothetical protein
VPGKSAESGAALIKGFVCSEVFVTKQQAMKAFVQAAELQMSSHRYVYCGKVYYKGARNGGQ